MDASLGTRSNRIASICLGLVLALIVALGSFFRLYDLDLSAFRADTILLYNLAQRKVPPSDVFAKWFEVSGATGQMPMPAWIMQVFVKLIGWTVTPFTVRLPFALVGIATIPVAFWAGHRFGGKLHGLFFALLVALNSFHIAVSREAYFYATALLGYFLLFGTFCDIEETFRVQRHISRKQIVLLGTALFFSSYSQITALVVCATIGLLLAARLVIARPKKQIFRANVGALLLTYAIVLMPLFFVSWGLRPLLEQIGANVDYGKKVVAATGGGLAKALIHGLLQFGWGWKWYGWFMWIISLAGGSLILYKRKDLRVIWIWVGATIMVAFFAAARAAAGALYEARYFAGLLPFYLCLATVALAAPFEWRATSRFAVVALWVGRLVALSAVTWLAYPAYLQTQLTGKPTPYWDIVRWTDARLPKGTLVLVDRWFEPWNELVSHPSTNVFFTFTVPNEPLDTFLKARWRDTAKAFFEKFPNAVLLEIAKEYYEIPGVGPWDWPRQYFSRHHAITNEAGLKLRQLGLVNRADFLAATTNRLIVEFFYDTREDLIKKWQKEGKKVACLFGENWHYAKPWQQTGDFRDWRVLSDKAVLEVYNLMNHPLTARIILRGTAVGRSKRVVTSTGASHNFMLGKLDTWTISLPELSPGLNAITLQDAASAEPADSLLWVSDVVATPVLSITTNDLPTDAKHEAEAQ